MRLSLNSLSNAVEQRSREFKLHRAGINRLAARQKDDAARAFHHQRKRYAHRYGEASTALFEPPEAHLLSVFVELFHRDRVQLQKLDQLRVRDSE